MYTIRTVKQNCSYCQQVFQAPVKEVNRGNARFCSTTCSNKSRKRTPKPNVKCAQCDKSFYLNNSKQKNSKSGLFFCCRQHKDLAQRLGGIKEIQPDHYGDGEYAKYRTKALAHYPHQCNRCGYHEHDILVVHHKDRNRNNNELENLEILCPNCHAIEHRCS